MKRELPADALPIFPLENVVLFPGVQVPLHIFEPRYRQMARSALSGPQRIGMVTLNGSQRDEYGQPVVFPVGCEGAITHSESLPDGRFNLVLSGLQRFRIAEEFPSYETRLYHAALTTALPENLPTTPREQEQLAQCRVVVMKHLEELCRNLSTEIADEISSEFLDRFDDPSFVNTLCQAIDFAPSEKQALLECDALLARTEQLEGLLAFRLAELRSGPGANAVVH